MRRLVIAVTGTPGTGKSRFASELSRRLGAELVRLNELVERERAYVLDEDGEKVVKLGEMTRAVGRILRETKGPVVVEGHLSHLLPTRYLSHVVVLRTHPRVLERRLRRRGYPEGKVRDNVEAEALDLILWEAVQRHGERVYEIDTSKRGGTVSLFLEAIKKGTRLPPGKVRWLEEYLDHGKRTAG
ncbi:MAG: adenylate kinase family protein [Candidatus Hadarchaeales archaeon]